MSSAFVVLTHVRSGSSMLCDMLARNGIGAAEEHLNLRFLGQDTSWHPEQVLAEARAATPGPHFGSKVMIHWLDGLKNHAGLTGATDVQLLEKLFGADVTIVHLYRADTVAAAVSFTVAKFRREWHRTVGTAATSSDLPDWEVLSPRISENVSWLDWCKHRLRMAASLRRHRLTELSYESLERETAAELDRVATAITGPRPADRPLDATTELVRQRDEESARLCRRWLSEHPAYDSAN